MNSIKVYYGSKQKFAKTIPQNFTTLSELVADYDAKNKEFRHLFVNHEKEDEDNKNAENEETPKKVISDLVAYSESYSSITESAVQGFVNFISSYDIKNLYLQNPPAQIRQQLEYTYPGIVNAKTYEYKKVNQDLLKNINSNFDNRVIGQQSVKKQLLVSLYPLLKDEQKPVVIMFYGPSGVGKTETAKYLSEELGQPLFRKQFSMFHSNEFSDYLFGGNHSQSCLARDLLERESNIILFDEFDKPNPVFHSAFYQLFDEGIFEDKNYHIKLFNSIIICTSNYSSEEEIRKYLGDPIFNRFDRFIKFNKLSPESVITIINNSIRKKIERMEEEEVNRLDIESIKELLYSNIKSMSNARQIDHIVNDLFDIQLLENMLNDNDEVE